MKQITMDWETFQQDSNDNQKIGYLRAVKDISEMIDTEDNRGWAYITMRIADPLLGEPNLGTIATIREILKIEVFDRQQP